MKWIFSGGVRYPVDDEARAFAAAEASGNAAEKPAEKAEKAAKKSAGKPKPSVPAEIKAAPARTPDPAPERPEDIGEWPDQIVASPDGSAFVGIDGREEFLKSGEEEPPKDDLKAHTEWQNVHFAVRVAVVALMSGKDVKKSLRDLGCEKAAKKIYAFFASAGSDAKLRLALSADDLQYIVTSWEKITGEAFDG